MNLKRKVPNVFIFLFGFPPQKKEEKGKQSSRKMLWHSCDWLEMQHSKPIWATQQKLLLLTHFCEGLRCGNECVWISKYSTVCLCAGLWHRYVRFGLHRRSGSKSRMCVFVSGQMNLSTGDVSGFEMHGFSYGGCWSRLISGWKQRDAHPAVLVLPSKGWTTGPPIRSRGPFLFIFGWRRGVSLLSAQPSCPQLSLCPGPVSCMHFILILKILKNIHGV